MLDGSSLPARSSLRRSLLLPVVVCLLGMSLTPMAWAATPHGPPARPTTTAPAPVLQPITSAYSEWGLGSAMAYDSDTRQLLLTGGVAFAATCGCDGTGGTWAWNGTDFAPVAPAGGGSIYGHLVADAAAHQLLRIGGAQADQSTPADDFARWDGTSWVALHPAHAPPPRLAESVAYDGQTNQLILFGGFSPATGARLADTWSWTGTDWVELHPATSPSARSLGAVGYDEATGQLVLQGGTTTVAGVQTLRSDTWIWTGTTWLAGPSGSTSPGPRAGAAITYDPALRRLVQYGGRTTADPTAQQSNELWAWTGAAWVLVPSVVGPTNVNTPALGFDPASGELVLLAPDRDKLAGVLHSLWFVPAPPTLTAPHRPR